MSIAALIRHAFPEVLDVVSGTMKLDVLKRGATQLTENLGDDLIHDFGVVKRLQTTMADSAAAESTKIAEGQELIMGAIPNTNTVKHDKFWKQLSRNQGFEVRNGKLIQSVNKKLFVTDPKNSDFKII